MNQPLTEEMFTLLNSLYDESRGRTPVFSDVGLNRVLEQPEIRRRLVEAGYADPTFGWITPAGVAALAPYRVERAVILAAGPSTRCIPRSLPWR